MQRTRLPWGMARSIECSAGSSAYENESFWTSIASSEGSLAGLEDMAGSTRCEEGKGKVEGGKEGEKVQEAGRRGLAGWPFPPPSDRPCAMASSIADDPRAPSFTLSLLVCLRQQSVTRFLRAAPLESRPRQRAAELSLNRDPVQGACPFLYKARTEESPVPRC
jgi:hypothetical protein